MSKPTQLNRQRLERLQKTLGEKSLKNLIEIFIANSQEKLDAAFEGMKSKDYEKVAWAAHSMISGSGSLGADKVKDISVLIEAAAMQKNEKEVVRLLPELKIAYDAALPELKKEIA